MKNRKHPKHVCALAALASLSLLMPTEMRAQSGPHTATPIKHVVVIFQENISFDHYFATYPNALNPAGETAFHATGATPRVNNLLSAGLLTHNPNSANPVRLGPADAVTCDQNHDYGDEQKAFNAGLMDKFPESVGSGGPGCNDLGLGAGIVMGYYDGNTVTGFWNYAQHFAMNDNSFSTDFGPSSVGAINLISGNTNGATLVPLKPNGSAASGAGSISGGGTTGALIGDPRPGFDDCSSSTPGLQNSAQVTMTGKNIGDLLNAKGLTWGWFQGGFAPTGKDSKGRAVCGAHHVGLAGDDATTQSSDGDYIPHHSPFQYYQQTANPHHLPPTSPKAVGTTDQANHNYDLTDFWAGIKAGNMPAVSFLKAGAYQDGHPGYSDPIDEQQFVVATINELEQTPFWNSTAVIILYDDSDGWYDHQMSPIVSQSNVTDDQLTGPGSCGVPKPESSGTVQNGRCGYGPRQPFIVISPFAKTNYVDHSTNDQASVIHFIEDNWGLPRIGGGSRDAIAGTITNMFDFTQTGTRKVFLDPNTGVVTSVVN
jgi:phospholipase C